MRCAILLFSLVAAFFLLAGFALMHAANGSVDSRRCARRGRKVTVFVLLAIGLLIKAGAIGVHVWLPGAYAEADDDMSAMLSAVVSKVAIFGLLVVTYVAIRSEITLELAHVLGWIGMLTTLAGAMMALRQDDMKRMLAYSSMSQIGYIVTAIALMSHLGWVTALYLVANHLMVKGILFLAAAAIILRTGTRSLDRLGGLARDAVHLRRRGRRDRCDVGTAAADGFGGKWLLLSAMMEKGWYGPAIMTCGDLRRLSLHGALRPGDLPRPAQRGARTDCRGAAALLIPQYLLIVGILVMSFLPKLLIEPISAAIDPYFASTLVWEGMSLEMIYGYWNPVPVMLIAIAAAAILFGLFWLLRATGWPKSRGRSQLSIYDICKQVSTRLTPSWASDFWATLAVAVGALAGRTRLLYTGNGQTYNLYIVYYFLALYMAAGGLRHL